MDEASGSGTRPRLKTYPGLNDQQAAQLEHWHGSALEQSQPLPEDGSNLGISSLLS